MLSERFHKLMDEAWPIAEDIEADPFTTDQRSIRLARLVREMNEDLCERGPALLPLTL